MVRPRPVLWTSLLLLAVGVSILVAAGTAQAADRAGDPVPWGIEALHGAASLEHTVGGAGIDVAVLDTGVDKDHPDLRQRVERCRNYTAESPRTGSCNDVDGHGTHVAGTVAADGGRDGEGIWGMAPEADVWAFKVCEDDGSCRTDRIGKAIRDAARLGAEIVVLSLGGQPEPFVQTALNASLEQDVLPVAAAGNEGPNLTTIKYPAADRLAVSVGAVGREQRGGDHGLDNLAVPDFSSRGAPADGFEERDNLTELAAPGFGVRSTATGGGYSHLSGTSMAAPHVAGLAARLWEVVGDADGDGKVRDDVREAIRDRAAKDDITEGEHAAEGYDPAAGIGLPRLQSLLVRIDGPSAVLVSETALLEAAANGRFPVASYEWDLDGDGTVDATGPTANATYGTPGNRTVELQVTDEEGKTARDRREIRVHRRPEPAFHVDPPVPVAGEAATLDGTASRDPDGRGIAAYRWTVDGATLTGPVVETSLTATGPTNVTLGVTDADGASNATTRSVLVNDRPQVRILLPSQAVADETLRLEAQVTDTIGDVEVSWLLPDGSTLTGPVVERAFPAGTHPISAVAADTHGARGSATETLAVREAEGFGPIPAAGLPWASTALAAAALAARRRR